MNLYEYLVNRSSITTARAAKEAKEAYERFMDHIRLHIQRPNDVDPFVFAFVDHGYQAFTFKPDQAVDVNGELAVVTGWCLPGSTWKVKARTAEGEFCYDAEELKLAEYPDGLVEIIRGDILSRMEESFAKRGGAHGE